MVDAADSFLNNAVDLCVQAVDYYRISTSQIPTPVGARIQQIKPEFGDVWQMSADSGDTMPDSGQTGRRGRIRPECRITGQNGRTPGIWLNLLPAGPETGQDGRFPVNWPRSGRIPATLLEFVYAKF
jgi:hypothetical protein